MNNNRCVKSVSFSSEREGDLIKHIEKFDNFSSYIKFLIIKDMDLNNQLTEIQESINQIKCILENKNFNFEENLKNEDDKFYNGENKKVDKEQKNMIENILNLNNL